MEEVLISIELIEWAAKNVHYRANDEWFYAIHLLADKVDFGTAEDDIKEAYYLGFKKKLPPTELFIHSEAVNRMKEVNITDNKSLITLLMDYCETGLYAVEEAKREPNLMGGIHAILDGVSQTMLTIKGLCFRTLNESQKI